MTVDGAERSPHHHPSHEPSLSRIITAQSVSNVGDAVSPYCSLTKMPPSGASPCRPSVIHAHMLGEYHTFTLGCTPFVPRMSGS